MKIKFLIFLLIIFLSFISCDSTNVASPLLFVGSSNANLTSVTLSSGTLSPEFNKDITSYNATVSSSVSKITVTPIKENSGAAIWINDVLCVSRGKSQEIDNKAGNQIKIKIRAQDGDTFKYYTLTILNS